MCYLLNTVCYQVYTVWNLFATYKMLFGTYLILFGTYYILVVTHYILFATDLYVDTVLCFTVFTQDCPVQNLHLQASISKPDLAIHSKPVKQWPVGFVFYVLLICQ